ncbi:MAG: hypothetical protein AB7V46_10335 [Thermomicrobiales bacterium]
MRQYTLLPIGAIAALLLPTAQASAHTPAGKAPDACRSERLEVRPVAQGFAIMARNENAELGTQADLVPLGSGVKLERAMLVRQTAPQRSDRR